VRESSKNLCNLPLVLIHPHIGALVLARILVVDDDPAVRMTIQLVLERAGHSVAAAGDGRKGLAEFEAGDFDLLFLDIFMPGMDGLETMRLALRQRPGIPIIVISGRPIVSDAMSEPDFLNMAIKLGAVRTVLKPFKPADLLATVSSCLEAAKQTSLSPGPDRGRASG
jgi:CheY-like chemotaxis protein